MDINNHNNVVGTSETTASGDGNPHPFLHKNSTMTDINTLLSPADRAVWKLVEATAINDLGQIVGTGLFEYHKPRAYLLTPPLLTILANLKDLLALSGVLSLERESLVAKLESVEAAVERGDLDDARRGLDLYQDEVETFMRDRRLNRIQSTKLVAGVALIRREMEARE